LCSVCRFYALRIIYLIIPINEKATTTFTVSNWSRHRFENVDDYSYTKNVAVLNTAMLIVSLSSILFLSLLQGDDENSTIPEKGQRISRKGGGGRSSGEVEAEEGVPLLHVMMSCMV
jgi:hypothetical protein